MKKTFIKILSCMMVLFLLAGTGVSVCAADEDELPMNAGGIYEIPLTQV